LPCRFAWAIAPPFPAQAKVPPFRGRAIVAQLCGHVIAPFFRWRSIATPLCGQAIALAAPPAVAARRCRAPLPPLFLPRAGKLADWPTPAAVPRPDYGKIVENVRIEVQ
jgi:hypothetical protein